ncbi:surfactant protein Ba [Gouania willdenowi]|uniref:surfactant protein Ba n=1 Tax=Gouania willdenowi TaxID=441366 RepID=UPI00105574F9|nr:prosaposin-like [Gouania willdenowi]
MVFLTVALLLLSTGLKGSAFTLNTNEVQSVPDLENNGDVCKDCTQIFELLADLLSNPDIQTKMKSSIESVCDLLPGPAATVSICKQEVEKIFPMAISFITSLVKPADICKKIKLCHSGGKQTDYFMEEVLQVALTNINGEANTQCTFCIFIVKTLEASLPKDLTEDAVVQLLEQICQLLPPSYRNQCDIIIERFSKIVIEAILSYATPQAVCALLQVCKGQETLSADPCTVPTYRCRDVQTAVKCGNFFYCQRFDWKPLKSNSI